MAKYKQFLERYTGEMPTEAIQHLFSFEKEEDDIEEMELVDADGNLTDRQCFFPVKADQARMFSLEQI